MRFSKNVQSTTFKKVRMMRYFHILQSLEDIYLVEIHYFRTNISFAFFFQRLSGTHEFVNFHYFIVPY